jgi:hypothetical protein
MQARPEVFIEGGPKKLSDRTTVRFKPSEAAVERYIGFE